MSGVADKARFYLERSVPQLREWEQKEIFTQVGSYAPRLSQHMTDFTVGRMKFELLSRSAMNTNTRFSRPATNHPTGRPTRSGNSHWKLSAQNDAFD